MSDLYFNPDDVFLNENDSVGQSIHGKIHGADDTYDFPDYDDIGITHGGARDSVWGGKSNDTEVKSDIIKSNKRFSENKWLKPTKNSALDEIIGMIDNLSKDHEGNLSKDHKGDSDNKPDYKLDITRSKKSKSVEKGGNAASNLTFELSKKPVTNSYMDLPEFETVLKTQKYQLELRKK